MQHIPYGIGIKKRKIPSCKQKQGGICLLRIKKTEKIRIIKNLLTQRVECAIVIKCAEQMHSNNQAEYPLSPCGRGWQVLTW